MSTSIDAKLAAIDNILATPTGTPNVTLGLLNQAKNIADKDYKKGKIDTPFGNLFARDAVFLFDELRRMGVSDPSKLSAQVVGDKVVYKDGTTGNVVQESKVSEGGSLKLGKTGKDGFDIKNVVLPWRSFTKEGGDVEGYDLFMVPNEQGGLTLASDKVEQSNWLKFRDNILKPAAVVAAAYYAAPLIGEALGVTGAGAGATATGAGALGAEAGLASTIAGLSPETLAALEATGLANIPEIVGATGGLLDAGLAAGAVGLAGTAANAAGAAKAGTTLPGSTIANAATTAAKALLGGGDNNLLGNIVGSGVNLAMVQDAADKLRQQGQISQEQYNQLSNQLQSQYTNLGLFGQQGLENVGRTAAGMVGNFTPYGVTNQLFGTRVNPETGAVETTLTNVGEALYNPFARVAAQSAQAAEMTNVDQLAKDYYAKVAALSAPEIERQRLATEDRLRAQGRLGVSGSAFGGSSPELLAQEQAIARQQLERELQSRQAALGERGTLISQGNAAYTPISNLLGLQAQQQQLSGQLGQMAQQGRIAAAQLYAQPATQGYTSALNVGTQGLEQIAATGRLGIASNLQAQQAALAGTTAATQNAVGNLLTPTNITTGLNTVGKLLGVPGLG
jgi:hypothetical protein